MVVVVCSLGGSDYEPTKYIIATSPENERVGALEFSELAGQPAGAAEVPASSRSTSPCVSRSAGIYTIGLYDSLEGTETEHLFRRPCSRATPLLAPQAFG